MTQHLKRDHAHGYTSENLELVSHDKQGSSADEKTPDETTINRSGLHGGGVVVVRIPVYKNKKKGLSAWTFLPVYAWVFSGLTSLSPKTSRLGLGSLAIHWQPVQGERHLLTNVILVWLHGWMDEQKRLHQGRHLLSDLLKEST